MMNGYTIVYMDKDGFSVPYTETLNIDNSTVYVFAKESTAKNALKRVIDYLNHRILAGKPGMIDAKMLGIFKTKRHGMIPLSAEEKHKLKWIIGTLKVKRVKVV